MPLDPASPLIDVTPPRMLFAELVAGALDRTGHAPSPHAIAYLVDLLAEAVCPEPDPVAETFTEGLLRARNERGAVRAGRLRALGDRALFLSGFFADSLERRGAGHGWVAEAGRLAYTDLSSLLSNREVAWMRARLYRELAERFRQYAEVLTEVGDGLRTATPAGLVPLCARYLRFGRDVDRRRLLRRGLVVQEARGRFQ